MTQREIAVAKHIGASTNALKLLVGVLGVSVMLAANAAAAAKKQKPTAPQAANSAALCRGANLYHCGPIYNSTDYLGTDPDPFIRGEILRHYDSGWPD